MICAIMQPTYLPWIGYFDLIDRVDHFVFLDDVKVSKQSWGVRNRIYAHSGELFLTVPLRGYRDHENRLFCNTEIDDSQPWQTKHLKTIEQTYSKAPHFATIFSTLEPVLKGRYVSVAELNIGIIRTIADRCGIVTPLSRTSDLGGVDGKREGRLLKICRHLQARAYLSPRGSAGYLEEAGAGELFQDVGVDLYYHAFVHPEYEQMRRPFRSHMSMVDLLMNCGWMGALELIRTGRRPMVHYREMAAIGLSEGATSAD
jgi:hypothetical protein